jgi:hypothetical protein
VYETWKAGWATLELPYQEEELLALFGYRLSRDRKVTAKSLLMMGMRTAVRLGFFKDVVDYRRGTKRAKGEARAWVRGFARQYDAELGLGHESDWVAALQEVFGISECTRASAFCVSCCV